MRTPKIEVLSPEEAANALDVAEATLARWVGEAADLSHAAEVLASELAEAQARAADDLLDADDADEDNAAVTRIAGELLRRQTEQGIAVQTAARATERLVDARRAVLRARAGTLRTRAERLREATVTRQAKADQLMAALSEFEAVPFEPIPHRSDTGSTWSRPTLTQHAVIRARWLCDHASTLDLVAGQGTADQVLAQFNAGLPEQNGAERLVLALVGTSSAAVV
jgi:hypothetical protein